MKCGNCKYENNENNEFCEECGEALSEQDLSPPPVFDFKSEGSAAATSRDESEDTRLRYLELSQCKITAHASEISHIGLIKDEQEDRTMCKSRKYLQHGISIYLLGVTDGMGGYPGGENCAEIGLNEFSLAVYEFLPTAEDQNIPRTDFIVNLENCLSKTIPQAISRANTRVRKYLTSRNQEEGGATIVAAAILVDHMYGRVKIFGYSQGDARALLVLSDGSSLLLTKDQTVNGAPTRYLGAKDSIGTGGFIQDFWISDSRKLFPETILFYSDGLWQMLKEEELANISQDFDDTDFLVSRLIQTALLVEIPAGAGKSTDNKITLTGDDNISVVAIKFSNKKQIEEKL
jgi:serine/threonine protein phosphatase PrpC